MRWIDFELAAPELAAFGRERIAATGIVLLGTIRADGWPRISPCEAYFVDGDLMLGMMPGSTKVRDLERDPRLTAVTAQPDRHAAHGDLKLYGTAIRITDPDRRRAHADTQETAIGWRPSGEYPLYAIDIESAGFISFGKGAQLLRWRAGGGVEHPPHPESG
jgi:pyridoxamine 5'-phosphate oxidase-like protein